MKRAPRTVTECCPQCKRDGWTHRLPYVLATEEEQIELLGHLAAQAETLPWPEPGTPREPGTPPTYERAWAHGGATISNAIREGIELSREMGKPVLFRFNGVVVRCAEGSDPVALVREYDKNLSRRRSDQ